MAIRQAKSAMTLFHPDTIFHPLQSHILLGKYFFLQDGWHYSSSSFCTLPTLKWEIKFFFFYFTDEWAQQITQSGQKIKNSLYFLFKQDQGSNSLFFFFRRGWEWILNTGFGTLWNGKCLVMPCGIAYSLSVSHSLTPLRSSLDGKEKDGRRKKPCAKAKLCQRES